MNLTLTNNGTDPVTVANTGRDPWTDILKPGHPWETTGDDSILIVGDKIGVRDAIEQGLEVATAAARELFRAIKERRKPDIDDGDPPPEVTMTITNHGVNSIRVVLGDGVTDMTVAPGTSGRCISPGYLELRELGALSSSQFDDVTQLRAP